MIIDGQLQFSNMQPVTASAASTDQLDLSIDRNIGVGERMYFFVGVSTALTGTGTVNVLVQGATDAAFTSPVTMQDLGTLQAPAAVGASLKHAVGIPTNTFRYIRLYYTVSGTVSAGAVTAEIVKDVDNYRAYMDNSRIS